MGEQGWKGGCKSVALGAADGSAQYGVADLPVFGGLRLRTCVVGFNGGEGGVDFDAPRRVRSSGLTRD